MGCSFGVFFAYGSMFIKYKGFKMKKATLLFVTAGLFAGTANAGLITTFSDRAAFDSAVGSTTLEDFTDTHHFPIPGGELSSTSSYGTLSAGDIQAGVTYTSPVGSGNYFNIDAGGGFDGGFLDGFYPSTRDLTITYDPLVAAFGFETNSLMSNFDITINFLSAPSFTANYAGITDMQFFGFQSDIADIQSVVLSGNGGSFGFAIDNHVFGGNGSGGQASAVPEPTSLALLGLGLAGLGFSRRKKDA